MDLNAVRVFNQVVECGSFTLAAEELSMTKSTVSRKLSELEKYLGIRLITRSTRSMVLTAEGEKFYQSTLQMLEVMNNAELEVSSSQNLVQGPLNVVLPLEVGHQILAPYIHSFLHKYPDVHINLELSNREVDIIGEGIDLYAQVGELQDSNLISRYLGGCDRILVASPGYLRKFGDIKNHQDLKPPHQMIKVFNKAARYIPKWSPIVEGDKSIDIELPCQLSVNTITVCEEACIDGLGVAVLPEFICKRNIQAGKLIHLLPDYKMPVVSVHLIYADRQLMPKRKKLFIDFLLAESRSLREKDC